MKILLVTLIVVFALQEILRFYARRFPLFEYFALSNSGLASGYIWQLFTFQFLHANGFHLIFNLVGIYFFGRTVEERLGGSTFLKVYFLSGVAGGLLQSLLGVLVPTHFSIPVVGASAGVYGLIAAATLMEPDGVILFSFLFPIKARIFLYVITGISIFYIFVPDSQVAHGAHLGGVIAGWTFPHWSAFLSRLFTRNYSPRRSRQRELIKVHLAKGNPWARGRHPAAEDVPPEEFISKEVDPILDKISAHGIQSLTPQERKILDEAKSKMDRR